MVAAATSHAASGDWLRPPELAAGAHSSAGRRALQVVDAGANVVEGVPRDDGGATTSCSCPPQCDPGQFYNATALKCEVCRAWLQKAPSATRQAVAAAIKGRWIRIRIVIMCVQLFDSRLATSFVVTCLRSWTSWTSWMVHGSEAATNALAGGSHRKGRRSAELASRARTLPSNRKDVQYAVAESSGCTACRPARSHRSAGAAALHARKFNTTCSPCADGTEPDEYQERCARCAPGGQGRSRGRTRSLEHPPGARRTRHRRAGRSLTPSAPRCCPQTDPTWCAPPRRPHVVI
jgi:hypothetical protein